MEVKAGDNALAVYYERVSTHHAEQEESMENQRKLCESYLRRHPEIKLAEPIDSYSERISGKSDERPKFQQMMKRLEQRDIKYVLIKDFKRLSRSQGVSIDIKDHSKEYGYKFILLSTGQVYDPNEEQNRMMYGFESLLNEEVVHRQSEYGRVAHRQKCENKILNRNNVTFGYKYDYDKKDIVVDEEQAEVVRDIFNLYVFRNYGINEIRRYLISRGYDYSAVTVRKWLMETAYIGVFHLNKKGSELWVGKGKKTKRYYNPVDEWVPVERPDLAIVDKPIFDLAQRIRERRKDHFDVTQKKHSSSLGGEPKSYKQDRFKGTHLFSAKLYCGECDKSYYFRYADRAKKVGIYKDSVKKKDPAFACPNAKYERIYEDDLIDIAIMVINDAIDSNKENLDDLVAVIEDVLRADATHLNQIKSLVKKKDMLEKDAEKVFSKFIDAGDLSDAMRKALDKRYNELLNDISELDQQIKSLEGQKLDEQSIHKQIESVKASVMKWSKITKDNINRDVIDAFIDRMTIYSDGKLEIVLKTDDIASSSQTVVKMLPEQRRSRKSSSSFFDESRTDIYSSEIRAVQKALLNERQTKGYFTVANYTYEIKRGNRLMPDDRVIDVDVQIELVFTKTK